VVSLRGIGWGHSRGYTPLVATAQAWADTHPNIVVSWEKRSLWAFGEGSLDNLAREYDLLVIDHPFIGLAAERGLFLPLDEHLPPGFLQELASCSVGRSYESYTRDEHLWALPLDAACQVAASRPELLEAEGLSVPRRWQDVLELAASGKVALPLAPIDVLSCFLTLGASLGEPPLRDGRRVVSRSVGARALQELAKLGSLVDPACLGMNPIQVLNKMVLTEDVYYVPMTYGYSNYSRAGFAPRRLAFHDIPSADGSGRGAATLGGAGLAVSAHTPNLRETLEYAAWVTGEACQRSIYVLSGGQPAHRAAWEDGLANGITHDFFIDTLPTIDAAYLRPTYAGFSSFQTLAGGLLHEFMREGGTVSTILDELDRAYAESFAMETI
jgi:multiple sugar transport system substrate-binding protein